MKILAIIGNPKGKGSGHRVVEMIEDRMKRMGDIEFSYLFLKDANLKPCTGCYICMAKGEDKCPLKDDRDAIVQELVAADGVILSSPVYVDTVSSLMKNFIDRFAYMNHRPRLHHQKLLTVVNMAGMGGKDALSALKKSLGGARLINEVHKLAIATPPWLQTERAVAKKEQAIDVAAKKFYRACLDKSLPSLTFNRYMDFLLMQNLSLGCQQYLPADYAFYKDKAYYFDTKLNPIKVALTKAIVGVMMNFVKDIGPGNVVWPVTKNTDGS